MPTIHKRYRATEKGRLMALAASKRRQDRVAGIESNLSSLDVWVVFSAFAERCANCGGTIDLCVDHHEPLVNGHAISIGNAVILCRSCNGKKKARPPQKFYSPERFLAIDVAIRSATALAGALRKERTA